MINPIEAEQTVLSGCIMYPTGMDIARNLVPEDFSEGIHQVLFKGMIQMADSGSRVSPGPLLAILGIDRHTVIEGTNKTWWQYVGSDLTQYAGPLPTLGDHVKVVKDVADARRIRAACQAAMETIDAGGTGIDMRLLAGEVIGELDSITISRTDETAQRLTMAQGSNIAITSLEARRAGTKPQGLVTGIPTLDYATTGLHGGQLIILAGRPGMGKTSVGISMGMAAANTGVGVLVISLEMTGEELSNRVLSSLTYERGSGISYRDISAGKDMPDSDYRRVIEANYRARELPILIEQETGLGIAQIASRALQARIYFESKGVTLGLVIIDHIGLVKPAQRYQGNRVQEMTEISWGCKSLAKSMGLPVLALCQLNRGVESRDNKHPMLSDLRDSGSIEQDADIVLGLFREEYYLEMKGDQRSEAENERLFSCRNHLEIEILKQRQGPTRRITCFCDIGCNVITELTT